MANFLTARGNLSYRLTEEVTFLVIYMFFETTPSATKAAGTLAKMSAGPFTERSLRQHWLTRLTARVGAIGSGTAEKKRPAK